MENIEKQFITAEAIRHKEWDAHPRDTDRLLRIAADHGYHITRDDAVYAWRNGYSASLEAGWMSLDASDDEVWENLKLYLRLTSPATGTEEK